MQKIQISSKLILIISKDIEIKYITLTRIRKARYFDNYFKENKHNNLKTWNGIKQIINTNTKTQNEQINCIKINDNIITEPDQLASEFNNHFCSIAKKIEKKLVIPETDFTEYLGAPSCNSFFITPTTPQEIISEIKSLKNRKATGPGSINTQLLKICKDELSIPLSILVNMSFELGIFPSSLKLANVIPIFKKEDRTCLTNYRPISLLSNISKILKN